MHRLRIVVEETGEDSYVVEYCGTDRSKAEEAFRKATPRHRALFVRPSVSAWNRPTLTAAAPTKPVAAKPAKPAKPAK